jgi:hypothetical protein
MLQVDRFCPVEAAEAREAQAAGGGALKIFPETIGFGFITPSFIYEAKWKYGLARVAENCLPTIRWS